MTNCRKVTAPQTFLTAAQTGTQCAALAPVRLDLRGWAERVRAGVLGRLQGAALGVLAVRPGADVQVYVPRVLPVLDVVSRLDERSLSG